VAYRSFASYGTSSAPLPSSSFISVVFGPGYCCRPTVCVVWRRPACSLESVGLGWWWMVWASWCSTEMEGRVWRDRPLSMAEEGNPRFPRQRPFRPLCPIGSTSWSMYCRVLPRASGHRGRVFAGVVRAWERVTAVATRGRVHVFLNFT
jgi:hypothetical protein